MIHKSSKVLLGFISPSALLALLNGCLCWFAACLPAVQVIQTLMVANEQNVRQSGDVAQENSKLQQHCLTLGSNMETNAK